MTSFYYAMERTPYALKVSLFSIASNFCVNYLMVNRYGHVGLALGYSVTQGVSVLLLIFGMRGHGVSIERGRLLRSVAHLAVAGVLAGFAMTAVRYGMLQVPGLAALRTWLASGLVLSANLAVLFLVFAALGLWSVRLSPKAALAALKARRSV
jgi:peptidoglycan biosynthesis protein MviN/MurJ (putative lipid II flippase)